VSTALLRLKCVGRESAAPLVLPLIRVHYGRAVCRTLGREDQLIVRHWHSFVSLVLLGGAVPVKAQLEVGWTGSILSDPALATCTPSDGAVLVQTVSGVQRSGDGSATFESVPLPRANGLVVEVERTDRSSRLRPTATYGSVHHHVRHHEMSGMAYRELSRMEIIEVVRPRRNGRVRNERSPAPMAWRARR
jgi:hypothetical protein